MTELTARLQPGTAAPVSFWQQLTSYDWTRTWIDWHKQFWNESPFSKLFPLDPTEVCHAFLDLAEALAAQPALLEKQVSLLTMDQLRLGLWTARRMHGETAPEPISSATPDRRFQDADWVELLPFSTARQWYIMWSRWFASTTAQLEADESMRQRIGFYLRQWLDALSPANFPVTNPVVVRETLESGGENLQRGLQNLLADLERGRISLVPQERFKPGGNLALTPGQVVYRNELIELIQYAPSTKNVYAVPLLVLPPWINRYYVLDMRPGTSLMEYLVAQGYTVFVISWRNPDPAQAHINLEDYLKLGALAALKAVKSITKSRKVNLVGYCIGGTLLGILLAHLAAKRNQSVNSATFFNSLLDFSEVGETAIFVSEQQLAEVRARMEAKGYLSPDELSTIFRLMRSNDLIWNFVINNYLLGREPPAFDLMHWSIDGTRLPRAMQEYYLYNMYVKNNLSKPNALEFLGTRIDLARVRCPTYVVAGSEDHIVPWRTAFRSMQLLGGAKRFVLGKAGHITAIVAPPRGKRASYSAGAVEAPELEAWEAAASQHEGSWWADWTKWLARLSGKKGRPPTLGNTKYPPLEPAPGRYVLEA